MSVLSTVATRLQARTPDAAVDRVTLGGGAVFVELTLGERVTAGLAHRPPGTPPETDDYTVDTLAGWASGDVPTRVARTLGVATLNALSVPHVAWRPGDPMALLSPDVETIVTVGLFRPAFRKFSDIDVRVIERDPVSVSTPADVRVASFTPDETQTAMRDADVVFVTGSAFVYGGAAAYLDAAPTDATVVVIGATASFLPGPLFDRGVDIVAGAAVTDRQRARAAISDGACGTALHDAGVDKVYVASGSTPGVDVDTAVDTTQP